LRMNTKPSDDNALKNVRALPANDHLQLMSNLNSYRSCTTTMSTYYMYSIVQCLQEVIANVP
jgi:hypothetical protein